MPLPGTWCVRACVRARAFAHERISKCVSICVARQCRWARDQELSKNLLEAKYKEMKASGRTPSAASTLPAAFGQTKSANIGAASSIASAPQNWLESWCLPAALLLLELNICMHVCVHLCTHTRRHRERQTCEYIHSIMHTYMH